MQATESLLLVESYLDAVAARDFARARGHLADTGFEYISPIARFGDADAFAESMEGGVGAILHSIRIVHRFADDGAVCHVLDVTVSMADRQTRRIVQLARVQEGRIVGLEVIFDASEYHRMIGANDGG